MLVDPGSIPLPIKIPGISIPDAPTDSWAFYDEDGKLIGNIFKLADYSAKVRWESGLTQGAKWLAHNLPQGVVVTVLEEHVVPDPSIFADLGGGEKTYDMFGHGVVALHGKDLNNPFKSFFHRTVDESLGFFTLYDDIGGPLSNIGVRVSIFLSDWQADQLHSVSRWWIHDKPSYAVWSDLNVLASAVLYQHEDGGGSQFTDIVGRSGIKEGRLGDFSDHTSSFRWSLGKATLKKAEMSPAILDLTFTAVDPRPVIGTKDDENVKNTRLSIEERVSGDVDEKVNLAFNTNPERPDYFTYTVQRERRGPTSNAIGPPSDPPVPAPALPGALTIRYFSSAPPSTNCGSRRTTLSCPVSLLLPRMSACQATLTAQMVRMNGLPFQMTGTCWYEEALANTTRDPSNGWYSRTETFAGTVDVVLGVLGELTVDITPSQGNSDDRARHTVTSTPLTAT